MSLNSEINDQNLIVEDLDATQPMLESSPLQMSTPVRRAASLTNISPIDLTQSSPEERVSPEEKRGRFQRSSDHQRSSSLSNLSSNNFSDQNESQSHLNENVDISSGNINTDLQDVDGLPLLQKEPFRLCDKAATIMAIDIDKFAGKICDKVPQICPGKTAAYLVDLTKLGHPEDIVRDSYGSWGSNSGDSFYYAVDIESKSITRQNRGRNRKMAEDAKVDLKIRRRFYNHPQTNKHFKKSILIGYFGERLDVPKWAIISYEWLCDPFDFTNISHGNSKDKSKPFQPTAKSVINKLREGAKYLTPQQNIHSITDETGTVVDSSPAFVPRHKKQARDVSYRVPDSRKGKGGRPAKTDYDDVARMVFERPRFVRFFEPGKSPGSVRLFMGTDQSFHFGKKVLVDGRGILFADMTYRPCQKGYLTIISAQHPLLVDSETGRNALRPIAFSLTTERTTDEYRWMAEEFKLCIGRYYSYNRKSDKTKSWQSMTRQQKICQLDLLFLLQSPKDDILENVDASHGSLKRDIPGIPDENWGEMCKKAAVFTQNKMVFRNAIKNDLFAVLDVSGAVNVSQSQTDPYSLMCSKRGTTSTCKTFRDNGMNVCQHTLAVADFLEIRTGYEDFIKTKMATLTMTDLIASQVPKMAGEKSRQTNKRHRGGGASQHTYSTTVVRTTTGTPGRIMAAAQAQTRSMPDKLSNGSKNKPTEAQRAKLFDRKEISDTEPWYNTNKFELYLTKDYFATSSLARFCWSCKTFITEEAPPYDMVIVHKERFWIRDQLKWSAPHNLQNRLTHARYSCVIGKYPYFTPDLLKAELEVKDRLTPEQERFLADHLGVDFLNH